MIKVYGVFGWGFIISELMLILVDIFYQFFDVSGFDYEGILCELLKILNLLCQILILVLENDEIMMEIVVIVLMVFDCCLDFVLLVGCVECQLF